MSQVSVVVPTYNRAELLKHTLQSIRSQTSPPMEVIVVDDGSTDNTPEVCAALGQSIRYIRQENAGVGAARNIGICASTGEWIAFCDSDDLWVAEKLAVQIDALERSGAHWSVTDFSLIDTDGVPIAGRELGIERSFPAIAESGASAEDYLGEWLSRREVRSGRETAITYTGDAFGMLFLGNIALPSTAVVARHVIDRVGMFNESFKVAEDTEFFHRVASEFEVTVVMQPLSKYRVGHASLVAGNQEPLIRNAIRSLRQAAMLRPSLTAKERKAFRRGRRTLHARLAYERLAALDRKGARQALVENLEDQLFKPISTAIFLASFLPVRALRSLHDGKRALRGFGH